MHITQHRKATAVKEFIENKTMEVIYNRKVEC